ncbi:MAG TPA: sigma factor-like helix-turn-helix DNA-binding protein [Acidimicrobiales bacterium]
MAVATDGGFESWYRREHARLVPALLLVTGDLDTATEAADEAFARALARWDRVGRMESPNGWTYRVALNVLRRRARRERLEQRLLLRQPRVSAVPAPAGEAWAAVRELPDRQRTAVVLRFVADLTEEQIATVMGVTRSTVSSALADARRTLGRVLADDPEPLEARHV